MKRAGINTIEDLADKTKNDMFKIRNLGLKSFKEIKALLQGKGLCFKEEDCYGLE